MAVQAVVDAKAQIIVASDVTSAANDATQLVPMIAQAQAVMEPAESTPTTLADGGYANAAQRAGPVETGRSGARLVQFKRAGK